jgi:hypothetical protein
MLRAKDVDKFGTLLLGVALVCLQRATLSEAKAEIERPTRTMR